MTCQQCLKQFESKRADAKFCSATCRSKAKRATDNSATDNVATDNVTLNVTDNLPPGKTRYDNLILDSDIVGDKTNDPNVEYEVITLTNGQRYRRIKD